MVHTCTGTVPRGDEDPSLVRAVELDAGSSVLCLQRIIFESDRTFLCGGDTNGSIIVWDEKVGFPISSFSIDGTTGVHITP